MTEKSRIMPVFINRSHYKMGTNRYEIDLKFDATKNNAEIAVKSCSIYNSSFNITSAFGNNTFEITWIDGLKQSFVIPDGYYDFDGLNDYLQYCMVSKNWYFIANENNTSPVKSIFFLSFQANDIRYTAEISIFPVESKSGYSPAGTWISNNKYPQIKLSTGLMKIFGFSSQQTFPLNQNGGSDPDNLTFSSDTYPTLSPVFAYVLGCNWVQNNYNVLNPNAFHQIALSKSFGELIIDSPPGNNYMSVYQANYNKLVISLYDQNMNGIVPVDPEISLTLLIKYNEN